MAIATLTIDIVAKLANLQTGFDRAAQIAERNGKRIEQAFSSVSNILKGAVAGFGVQQLVAAFNATAEGLAKFKDVSEQTGIAVEELGKLEPVARGAGVALDQVGDLSLKLSKALSGVDDESRGAGKALAQIGVDLARFRSLGAAEQMQELAKALANYADDGNKAAIGQAILGKQWRQAAPFLKDLAEAGTLNATVTAEQAKAADDYGKALKSLQQDISTAARAVTLGLLPSIQTLIRELRDGIEVFGGFGAALRAIGTTNPLKSSGEQIADLTGKLGDLRRVQETLEAQQGGPAGGRAAFALEQVRSDIAQAENLLAYFKRQQAALALAGSGGILDANDARAAARPSAGQFTNTADAAGKTAKSVNAARTEAERFLDSLQKQAIAANYTAEQILRIEAAQKGVSDAAEPWIRSIEAAKQAAEDTRQLNQFLADETKSWLEEQNKLVQNLLDSADGLEELRIAGDDLGESLINVTELAGDLGFTFSSAFEDAIVGGKSLKDILRGLEQDILRIITRKLVTEPLANAVGGINFGSIFGGLFGGARAFGGPVSGGSAYLVGESGPELFVAPPGGGQIIPNGARMGSSVTINIAGSATRETANQIAAAVSRQLRLADARAF